MLEIGCLAYPKACLVQQHAFFKHFRATQATPAGFVFAGSVLIKRRRRVKELTALPALAAVAC
jgi:hypothetical protein